MAELKSVRVGDVCTVEKGVTGLAKATPGNYPLVATSAERKTSKDYQFEAKAVCIPLVSSTGHGKKTLNYVHYQEGKFALGSILAALIPRDEKVLSARYLHTYLQKNKDRVLVPLMKGAANVSLSVAAISNISIPLPPIKKQEAILEKIDSISNEHAAFLSEINIQASLYEKLRRAVLQEAVEGKLTAEWRKQNPESITDDNHASKLLKKIRTEKEILTKEGKIRKEKPLPPTTNEGIPFSIPNGWVWAYVSDLGASISYAIVDGPFGSHLVLSDYDKDGEFPVLTIGCIDEGFDLTRMRRINKTKYEQIKRSTIRGGDILMAKIGSSYGKLGEYPYGFPDGIIPANLLKITLHVELNKTFVKYALISPVFKKALDRITQFHAQPAFNIRNFKRLLFPIPPRRAAIFIFNIGSRILFIILLPDFMTT